MMKLHRCLFTIGFLFAAQVNAQVYKCTLVDNVTRQNRVVYSDSPCAKAEKQTLIDIQGKSQLTVQTTPTTQSTPVQGVDAAVTRAVLNQDFKLAKTLATTKEHWRLIAIAEGEAAPQPLIAANNQTIVSPAYECALAKEDFESTSRTSWRDKDLIAAKKSVMYAACGVSEPIRSSTIFVGRSFGGVGGYGGLYNQRQYHRHHAVPHQGRPHGNIGSQAYSKENRHHYGRHQTGGTANFGYKSKHFGITAETINAR